MTQLLTYLGYIHIMHPNG